MSKSNINYAAVLAEAHKAASEAVDGQPDQYACGFAWVVIYGNDPLARYCRAQLKLQPGDDWKTRRYFGDRGYPRGWHFWQPGNFPGQSVDTHLKGATAFRAVLAKYGIRADVNSRLD
jgi:hypothetical protein